MRHLLKISFLYIVVLCSYTQALEFAIKNFSPYEILFIQDSYLQAQNGITAQNLCNNGVQEVCDRIIGIMHPFITFGAKTQRD
ncbi:hypothetical protein [Helicobacter labetoulli]|uniref:hypothetical protein n=1 Tax=Helicobacter labetoulli TaxID=2315333 RepID=UPI001FC956CD|nr:hypothetical protein [Helicobacter labetoulli]